MTFEPPSQNLVRLRIKADRLGFDRFGHRDPNELDAATVYDLPYNEIQPCPSVTTEVRRIADLLWPRVEPLLGPRKLALKRREFGKIVHALACAAAQNGCVAYQRHLSETSKISLQLIDAAERIGFVRNVVSPKGAPKMSRLVPMPELVSLFDADPWLCDGERICQFVYLKTRATDEEDGEEIDFDRDEPFPAEVQRKLAVINATNCAFEIWFRPFDKWQMGGIGRRQLRPVHYAVFTDTWERHGRIYTGKYGHQALRGDERQSIYFRAPNGEMEEHGVELDFSGMHTRLCYHLAKQELRTDPYALWSVTTPPMRLLAKVTINAALNAETREGAISALNQMLNPKTEADHWKSGKAKDDASLLREAVKATSLKFADIYDLAIRHHEPIRHRFGSDAGMELMNIDGKIALDVLYHFTSAGVPCLGVHDSFIVPQCFFDDLREVMISTYRDHIGFDPVVD